MRNPNQTSRAAATLDPAEPALTGSPGTASGHPRPPLQTGNPNSMKKSPKRVHKTHTFQRGSRVKNKPRAISKPFDLQTPFSQIQNLTTKKTRSVEIKTKKRGIERRRKNEHERNKIWGKREAKSESNERDFRKIRVGGVVGRWWRLRRRFWARFWRLWWRLGSGCLVVGCFRGVSPVVVPLSRFSVRSMPCECFYPQVFDGDSQAKWQTSRKDEEKKRNIIQHLDSRLEKRPSWKKRKKKKERIMKNEVWQSITTNRKWWNHQLQISPSEKYMKNLTQRTLIETLTGMIKNGERTPEQASSWRKSRTLEQRRYHMYQMWTNGKMTAESMKQRASKRMGIQSTWSNDPLHPRC